MCGIAGIVARRRELVEASLPPMVAAQCHRGPDDVGSVVVDVAGAFVGLGHRRLSILDLSPAGHQPMVHPQTGDQIVFNGEVYNFEPLREELLRDGAVFRGHSDTEVILHGLARFGPSYIDRLEGMFALAFLDARNKRLLLARDPIGIKPLYIAATSDALLFASEVRAILASNLVPRRMDRRGLTGFLAFGAVQEPCTLIEGIRAFPAGHWQEIDLSERPGAVRSSPHRYWQVPDPREDVVEQDVLTHLESLLDTAVREHLVSDVPVGVFLSSGIDSSVVAALAARHTRKLPTFTVGFAEQPDMNESPYAVETARQIGSEHHNVEISGETALAAAGEWVASQDQPSVDGLNTYVISKAVRAQGIVVAISGLGGDELFGGYSSFRAVPKAAKLMRAIRFVPKSWRRGLSAAALASRPLSVRRKAADVLSSSGSLLEIFLHSRRMNADGQLQALGLGGEGDGLVFGCLPAEALRYVDRKSGDPIWQISLFESKLYMGNTLLRDTDTNGMAHSLEIRPPLLDRRVLEFVLALPGSIRLPPNQPTKYLLRRAFEKLLRPELLQLRKRGFTLPVGRWITGPLRGLCEEGMEVLRSGNVLRADGVDAIWRDFQRAPDVIRYTGVLSLTILGQYCRRLGVTAG